MFDSLTATDLRLLLATLSLAQQGKQPTLRRVCKAAGFSGTVGNHDTQFQRLRQMGLLTWEQGKGGTLRPTCTLEIVKE